MAIAVLFVCLGFSDELTGCTGRIAHCSPDPAGEGPPPPSGPEVVAVVACSAVTL